MKSLVAMVVLGVGCGGAPSRLDLCYQGCDRLKTCEVYTDVQTANCKTECDRNRGQYSDDDADCDRRCQNCTTIRANVSSCINSTCELAIGVACYGRYATECVLR